MTPVEVENDGVEMNATLIKLLTPGHDRHVLINPGDKICLDIVED